AVRFILEAESKIYTPIREGLETIRFSRPLATPLGVIGMERYAFRAPDRIEFSREFNEEVPGIEEIRKAMSVDPKANQMRAEQTISMYLGTFLTYRLDEFQVCFLASSADSVRIRCKAKPGSASGEQISYKDMIFTPEGLIQKIKIVNNQAMTQTIQITLKEMESIGQYLLDQVEISNDNPANPMKTTQHFFYEKIKGFQIVARTEVEVAPLKQRVEFRTQDIGINEPEPETRKPETEKKEEAEETGKNQGEGTD
ncbi:MAG: hypothetical protein ABIK28_06905, partial [Planctomycetota bacterium]